MRSGTFVDDFTRSTTLQYRATGEEAAMTATIVDEQEKADLPLSGWRLEFEITGRCQLACIHCYADSGPTGDHGTMTEANWRELISDARRLGVSQLQLIGGEPTMHPRFTQLLRHAIDSGLPTEVFSNLVQVRDEWWDLYAHPSVSLATSTTPDQAPQHEAVTGRQQSYPHPNEYHRGGQAKDPSAGGNHRCNRWTASGTVSRGAGQPWRDRHWHRLRSRSRPGQTYTDGCVTVMWPLWARLGGNLTDWGGLAMRPVALDEGGQCSGAAPSRYSERARMGEACRKNPRAQRQVIAAPIYRIARPTKNPASLSRATARTVLQRRGRRAIRGFCQPDTKK